MELTTLRQPLVRKKNRKLRRLRELYPDVRIKLFYARDFRALMLKFGKLALADGITGTPGQVVPSPAARSAGGRSGATRRPAAEAAALPDGAPEDGATVPVPARALDGQGPRPTSGPGRRTRRRRAAASRPADALARATASRAPGDSEAL